MTMMSVAGEKKKSSSSVNTVVVCERCKQRYIQLVRNGRQGDVPFDAFHVSRADGSGSLCKYHLMEQMQEQESGQVLLDATRMRLLASELNVSCMMAHLTKNSTTENRELMKNVRNLLVSRGE